ncbi:acid phosphatase PHOa [Aspergillus candidus]|uniref:Acid phosphatase n=1 Tax=Aspergillus candidus TaxID=41067 RepID=A0A2I2FMW3_ASPCN|nr:phosphoesterase-domain-containing protein [Aspergillus candidus]PLB41959.1 phosphoesterase-domain-containing protein [Aspergillus candidus]
MNTFVASLVLAASLAQAQVISVKDSEPSIAQITKAQKTTEDPLSPVSNVEGDAFHRFYQIWLENIDFEDAEKDENNKWLADQGITLTNFYAITHPSQPNYLAAAGGDAFGMDHDEFVQVPENVSTVADMLDTKHISWAEYQEHIPYPGFQGMNYSNQETYEPDYVRKHNPFAQYNSVTKSETRLRQIKSFKDFEDDLKNEKLPQWAFITPNMTNDAHDTNITFAAKWQRDWVAPLLKNPYFMKDTLLLLTFDEDKTFPKDNRIFSVLLGGAIPEHLKGTKDNTFYTHYSAIASVSANWGIPSLGRWDCGANLFQIIANRTGYVNYEVDTKNLRLNETNPGPLSDDDLSKFNPEWPVPLTEGMCSAGHGILDIVKKTYKGHKASHDYTKPFPVDTKAGYNVDVKATKTKVESGLATPHPSSDAAASQVPLTLGSALTVLMAAALNFF